MYKGWLAKALPSIHTQYCTGIGTAYRCIIWSRGFLQGLGTYTIRFGLATPYRSRHDSNKRSIKSNSVALNKVVANKGSSHPTTSSCEEFKQCHLWGKILSLLCEVLLWEVICAHVLEATVVRFVE